MRPVRELTNWPAPVPSLVFESDMVGFVLRLQHIPLAVMSAPPSDIITPPLVPEVAVILVIEEVDNVGSSSFLHECNMHKKIMIIRPGGFNRLFIEGNIRSTTTKKGGTQI